MKNTANKYFILIIVTLFCLLPLEIYNTSLNNVSYTLILAFIIKLTAHLLRNKNLLLKITATIGLIICTLSTLLFALRFLLCGWHNIGTLYVNKHNNSLTLICKTYDCYGTSEDCRLYKSNKITSHIKWITRFEETPIDTTKWRIVPFGSIKFEE